jgi:agmatinase
LPRRIYLTVDMDFFDPGAVPGVGTPEPGGADWYRGLEVVQAVLAEKMLVGADIVELCPPQEGAVSVRAAARMLLLILEKSRSA